MPVTVLGARVPISDLLTIEQYFSRKRQAHGEAIGKLAHAHLTGTIKASAQGSQDEQHPRAAVALHCIEGLDLGQGLEEGLVAAGQHIQVSHHEGVLAALLGQEQEGEVGRRLGPGVLSTL